MSSTVSFPSASSSSSSSSPTPTTPPPQGMPKAANYFFGFLVTFVVILLAFIAFGLSSRRGSRFVFNRRGVLGTAWDGTSNTTGGRAKTSQMKPKIWDIWLREGTSPQDMIEMPITATYLEPELPKHPQAAPPAFNPGKIAFPTFHKPERSAKCPHEEQPPGTLQVAVMIAMPSPYHHQSAGKYSLTAKCDELLGEHQIGILRVPWEGEIE